MQAVLPFLSQTFDIGTDHSHSGKCLKASAPSYPFEISSATWHDKLLALRGKQYHINILLQKPFGYVSTQALIRAQSQLPNFGYLAKTCEKPVFSILLSVNCRILFICLELSRSAYRLCSGKALVANSNLIKMPARQGFSAFYGQQAGTPVEWTFQQSINALPEQSPHISFRETTQIALLFAPANATVPVFL